MEPFSSSGTYDELGELAAARTFAIRRYGTDGTSLLPNTAGGFDVVDGEQSFSLPNRDFDVRSFRSNLVLRWEWRAGSTLFLVWQQDRFSRMLPDQRANLGSLLDAATIPGDHFLALKISYWLSM